MAGPRVLPALTVVSVGLAALTLAPLVGPGHLLYRDAVSTPRSFVTDGALGVGDRAPRAVPQDWLIAMLSHVVDGGFVVVALTFVALVAAGTGTGLLAHRLVPAGGRGGAIVAAVVTIWNPFVAERLLQGHWSLLIGCAALGWLVVLLLDLRDGESEPGHRDGPIWALLISVTAAAGLTPTGSVLAAIVLLTIGIPLLTIRSRSSHRARRRGAVAALPVIAVLGALPWLTAAVIGGASVTSGEAGVTAFAVRAEPGLGTLGTVAGLGGIWNADAVPSSRTIWWAAVATGCLLLVVAVGSARLVRDRRHLDRSVALLAGLAVVTLLVIAVSATGVGESVLSWMVREIPGAGLFRDTQKFVALMVPFAAVAAAAAVASMRRWVPVGFAVAAALLLVVAPLPDQAWGVGDRIGRVHYPADWTAVADRITSDDGAVALWPSGTVRRYAFSADPSLDPTARLVRATVLEPGALSVDGVEVDPPDERSQRVDEILAAGGDPARLAAEGVGWVLVEGGDPPAQLGRADVAYRGTDLTLIRIDGASQRFDPSPTVRAIAWTTHLAWLVLVVGGGVIGAVGLLRRRRSD
ncbi:hypothetical protein [Gordonia soli]|uniref:Glycosyltransferase RgtA/B/C/D-like domain-containing protein n=1 Tax=Gordonia soli NBRC 108243 TaxID=1223545 RepID=M0QFY3_9ACTN|nr:hypothetical protein [Gordonia soli]GAC67221.1 hypothetical protein GS4_06_00670 [Gordonia soli NBRC 108243]